MTAGGVTIITHGFNSNVTDWIIPMAGKMITYPSFPGATYSCYEISITRNGSGQYVAAATFLSGTPPLLTDSGEIVVKLDWSTLSNIGGASSTTVAQTTVNALLATNLIPELGGRPLVELPLHLIGHSRGGSVITEMARLLGAQGIWVDQVTTLDPRPVSALGDAAVTSWTNVLFADNFWQTMGDGILVPNGQSVFGAYNRHLLDLNGGYSSSHSDVHLWYHGTIDLATPTSDTQANITATQRSTWWTSTEMGGAAAGFLYSLIGGGNRLSNLEPGGTGTGRIIDGFNKNWDLGGGTGANRTALPADAGLWPNAILFALEDTTIPAGQSFDATLYYQAGASAVGNFGLTIFLDVDFNPYNGNEIEVNQQMLSRTGTGAVFFNTLNSTVDAADRAARQLFGLRAAERWHAHTLSLCSATADRHAQPAATVHRRGFARAQRRRHALRRAGLSRPGSGRSRVDRLDKLGSSPNAHLYRHGLGICGCGRGQFHQTFLSGRACSVRGDGAVPWFQGCGPNRERTTERKSIAKWPIMLATRSRRQI